MKNKLFKLVMKITCMVLLFGSVLYVLCAIASVMLIFIHLNNFTYIWHSILNMLSYAFLSIVCAVLSLAIHYIIKNDKV